MNDQRSVTDQLRDLIPIANQHGLYDAADYLTAITAEKRTGTWAYLVAYRATAPIGRATGNIEIKAEGPLRDFEDLADTKALIAEGAPLLTDIVITNVVLLSVKPGAYEPAAARAS